MCISNPMLAVFTFLLSTYLAQDPSSGIRLAEQGPAGQAPTRVAVADLQAIEKALGGSIEAFQEQRLAPVNAKAEELRTLQLRILRERDTLAAEVYEQMQQQARQLKQDITQEEQAAFRDVQSRRAAQRAALAEHLAKVAAARHVQIVLNRREAAVLWVDSAIDLTDDVIKSVKSAVR